jgi:hypothetical protein
MGQQGAPRHDMKLRTFVHDILPYKIYKKLYPKITPHHHNPIAKKFFEKQRKFSNAY